MKYTLIWKPTAEAELASLWTSAEDRQAITAAADAIDVLLRTDPNIRGESRSGPLRVLLVPPLGVDFEVYEAERRV